MCCESRTKQRINLTSNLINTTISSYVLFFFQVGIIRLKIRKWLNWFQKCFDIVTLGYSTYPLALARLKLSCLFIWSRFDQCLFAHKFKASIQIGYKVKPWISLLKFKADSTKATAFMIYYKILQKSWAKAFCYVEIRRNSFQARDFSYAL